MQDVLCLILGGGRGARLYPLTRDRSEPAVPLAGKYRLIDVPVSNCLNSGLDRIYILTQFLSVSLHQHIAHTYKANPFHQGFVEVLAAQQTNEAADWYQGTADALRQNLRYVEGEDVRDVLVLCGDQIYRMDFGRLVEAHRRDQADVTLTAVPVPQARAADLGVLGVADDDRVTALVEKPQRPEQLDRLRAPPEWLRRRGCEGADRKHLANAGIYLFRREVLFDLLRGRPSANDLVTEVLAPALAAVRVRALLFADYWEDVGSIESYFAAHMALVGDRPPFDFHSADGVIYTRARNLPASRIGGAAVEYCLITDGCWVARGARLRQSVIGLRSRVAAGASLAQTILLGSDSYETPAQLADNRRRDLPDLGVGEGAVLERAIVDKNCRIGRGARILNARRLLDADEENYVIRNGIVVLPRGTVVPEGEVI
jgi:glucose-1-phosphate adenylyltransferase